MIILGGVIVKKSLIFFICLFLISACKPSEKDFISIGEGIVKDSLKDPESAKFSSFFHASSENEGYVCGDVNAKNSYGGYTGKKPYFIYIETNDGKLTNHGPVTIVADDDKKGLEKYQLFCQ